MNVCRACLVTKETFSYFLFDNVSIDTFIFCISIQTQENEQLPRSLCNNCYELLIKYSDFKRTCLESHKTLLRLHNTIKEVKDENIVEILENRTQYEDVKEERSLGSEEEFNYEAGNCFDEIFDVNQEYKESKDDPAQDSLDYVRKLKRKVKIKRRKTDDDIEEQIPRIKRPSYDILCTICNKKKFKHEFTLEAHKLICEGKVSEITCPRCYKTFPSWKNLLRHMKDDHINPSIKCPICGKACKTKRTLKNHVKIQHAATGTGLYICDVCRKQFTKRTVLKRHLQIHNVIAKQIRKPKFSCKYTKIESDEFDVGKINIFENKRMPKIKPKRPPFNIVCPICKKRFKHEFALEAHRLMCEGKVSVITCPRCYKTFTGWSNLLRHIRDEHMNVNMGLLKCPTCGIVCKTQPILKRHIKKQHKSGEKDVHVCDVCGKHLANADVLKRHLETHNENRERNFSCEQCNKKFLTKCSLRSHVVASHEGQRFICNICSYPFTNRGGLIDHLLSHEGIKKYKCDICEKSFAKSGTLVIHKRTHSGERPYPCSYCQKRFISTTRLSSHVRTHTGERPYACVVCNQTYTAKMSLNRHMKVHNKVPVLG